MKKIAIKCFSFVFIIGGYYFKKSVFFDYISLAPPMLCQALGITSKGKGHFWFMKYPQAKARSYKHEFFIILIVLV